MGQKPTPSAMERIDVARADAMVRSLAGDDFSEHGSGNEWEDPSRKLLSSCSDDDLAEIIGRDPSSKTGLIASSILRQREAWRSPSKWSLVIAGLSLLVALAAFARTL